MRWDTRFRQLALVVSVGQWCYTRAHASETDLSVAIRCLRRRPRRRSCRSSIAAADQVGLVLGIDVRYAPAVDQDFDRLPQAFYGDRFRRMGRCRAMPCFLPAHSLAFFPVV